MNILRTSELLVSSVCILGAMIRLLVYLTVGCGLQYGITAASTTRFLTDGVGWGGGLCQNTGTRIMY